MKQVNCIHFNGYKPCGFSGNCDSSCEHVSIAEHRIVIVHLGALGAVLRSTSILPAIRRKYKNVHITWVTDAPAHLILKNNTLIDRVVTSEFSDILKLTSLKFDMAFCIDKSLKASGVLGHIKYNKIFGFKANECTGAILPVTRAAQNLWEIGLDDHLKFNVNKKTEQQLNVEALELEPYNKDEYSYTFTDDELVTAAQRRRLWSPGGQVVVGINTGCAPTIAYKKISIKLQKIMIKKIAGLPNVKVVLLGGREDSANHIEIAQNQPGVILSPTQEGLRDGFCSVEACDIVVSGDSFGMHMAIALKKWVVAWFGPTCDHEIELYGRGVKLKSPLECAPCWKRNCDKLEKCNDLVDIEQILTVVKQGIKCKEKTSSFKQHLSETPSSVSL